MLWYYQVYISIVLFFGIFSAILAAYAWRHRSASGALALAACMGITTLWDCIIILRIINTEPAWDIVWYNLRYIALAGIPVILLIFALQFSGWHHRVTARHAAALCIIPAITQLVAWYHGFHGHLFSPGTSRWYGVHTTYSYLLTGGALLLLMAALPRASAIRRRQIALLIIGILLPVGSTLFYTLQIIPFGRFDLNAPALGGTGLCWAWSLFRYQLFDLAPIARSALFESMDDSMFVLDRQERIIDINPAAERLIGQPRSEVLGRAAGAAFSSWQELMDRFRDQPHVRTDFPIMQGELRMVYDLRISPLYNHRKQISGKLVMLRDISERKRTEEALRESRIQLEASYQREQERRALSDTLREALTLVSSTLDPKRVVGLLLDELQKVVTYHFASVMLVEKDQLVRLIRRNERGDSYRAVKFPIDLYPLNAAVLEKKQPIIVGSVEQDERWKVSRETEDVRSLLNTPLLVKDRPIGVLCIGRHDDVTYSDDDADIVFAFAMQVAIAVENSRLADETRTALIDHQFMLERLQRTQKRLVESEKMAALGKLIANVAHEINTPVGAIRASATNITTALHEALRALPDVNQALSPDLQALFWEFVMRALRDKQALSSAEERQRRRVLRQQLEAHQLADADVLADTLVDMGIYDEITPLLPLFRHRQQAALVKVAYNLAIQQHQSHNILTAVNRAAKVVFALRTYANINSAGPKSGINISGSINAVLALYKNHLKPGIDVKKTYGELLPIHGCPEELAQVWTNLIYNAIQAMGGKGVLEISASLSRNSEQADAVLVRMIDSGPGIPEKIQPHIFEPFFTTKPAGEGSGLGLDICQKIVEKHEGTITFESRPGRTAFQVRLPVRIE